MRSSRRAAISSGNVLRLTSANVGHAGAADGAVAGTGADRSLVSTDIDGMLGPGDKVVNW
jgi:hypothetical protein